MCYTESIAIQMDAYDSMSAADFLRSGKQKKPFISLRKRKMLNRLIRSQQSGHDSNESWWDRYHRYVHSPRWYALKERLMRERGVSCERCGKSGSTVPLHLHHVSYANLGQERDEDLKLYCEPCHKLMHPNKQIGRAR